MKAPTRREQKMMDDFIRIEADKTRAGSGDDEFYCEQVRSYINGQRLFWINAMKYFMEKGRKIEIRRQKKSQPVKL